MGRTDAARVAANHRASGGHQRPTLFRRLFVRYVLVLGLAVAALVLAPVTVSVPTSLDQLIVILAGFVVAVVAYRTLLQRALVPLERLTAVMRTIDPLEPGRRVDAEAPGAEVAALGEAFNEMLDRLEDERRESARRALAAQEAERRRVARELHDEIGQLLTGLLLRSDTLSRRAPEELRADLEEMREAARHAAEEVRVIARRLRPEALDELGLQSALLALATSVEKQTGITVDRHLQRELPLTAEEELVIYRVAQESFTNVIRHSSASAVYLSLGSDSNGGVELVIRDDGVGLPASIPRTSTGIAGMRERALLVGAQVSVRSVQPHGTEVRCTVPAAPAEAGDPG